MNRLPGAMPETVLTDAQDGALKDEAHVRATSYFLAGLWIRPCRVGASPRKPAPTPGT